MERIRSWLHVILSSGITSDDSWSTHLWYVGSGFRKYNHVVNQVSVYRDTTIVHRVKVYVVPYTSVQQYTAGQGLRDTSMVHPGQGSWGTYLWYTW